MVIFALYFAVENVKKPARKHFDKNNNDCNDAVSDMAPKVFVSGCCLLMKRNGHKYIHTRKFFTHHRK